MNNQDYAHFVRPHSRALEQLRLDFQFFIEDVGNINLYSVEHRVKDFGSASEKAIRLKRPVAELQDIAGLRVVAGTASDVEVITRFFTRQEFSKDLRIESDKAIRRRDGYSARHLVISVPPHYSRSAHEVQIEVQLLTILQHAFNFLSRNWVYKEGLGLPKGWQEELASIATALMDIDRRVSSLYPSVTEEKVRLKQDDLATPFSYLQVIREEFGESRPLPDAVDCVRMLVDIGVRTNGELRNLFRSRRIRKFLESISRQDCPVRRPYWDFLLGWPKNMAFLHVAFRIDCLEHLLNSRIVTDKPERGD